MLPTKDKDWESVVTLKVTPCKHLTTEQREAVERDFAIIGATLKIVERLAGQDFTWIAAWGA